MYTYIALMQTYTNPRMKTPGSVARTKNRESRARHLGLIALAILIERQATKGCKKVECALFLKKNL